MTPQDQLAQMLGRYATPTFFNYGAHAQQLSATAHTTQVYKDANSAPTYKTEVVMAVPKEKQSAVKSAVIVLVAMWLGWKIWTERDKIVLKIEELASELGDKLGLNKKEEAK